MRAVGLRFGFYYSLLEWDRQYTNITGTSLYDPTTDYVNHTMIPDLKDLVAAWVVTPRGRRLIDVLLIRGTGVFV